MRQFNSFLKSLSHPSYAALRIMAALMFMAHGTQKLFGFPSEFGRALNPMSATAATIEVVAGVLIAIGLFTRLSAFVSSGMCAVGYWLVHGSRGFYPIENGGELIALYCFIFLMIATHGPGNFSVDAARGKS